MPCQVRHHSRAWKKVLAELRNEAEAPSNEIEIRTTESLLPCDENPPRISWIKGQRPPLSNRAADEFTIYPFPFLGTRAGGGGEHQLRPFFSALKRPVAADDLTYGGSTGFIRAMAIGFRQLSRTGQRTGRRMS